MKRVSSQPLLCVALFLAGCLCFLVALNPEWLSGEDEYGGPVGGGRIPGLEPPAKMEEAEAPETPEVPKEEREPEDTSDGKDPAASPGSP